MRAQKSSLILDSASFRQICCGQFLKKDRVNILGIRPIRQILQYWSYFIQNISFERINFTSRNSNQQCQFKCFNCLFNYIQYGYIPPINDRSRRSPTFNIGLCLASSKTKKKKRTIKDQDGYTTFCTTHIYAATGFSYAFSTIRSSSTHFYGCHPSQKSSVGVATGFYSARHCCNKCPTCLYEWPAIQLTQAILLNLFHSIFTFAGFATLTLFKVAKHRIYFFKGALSNFFNKYSNYAKFINKQYKIGLELRNIVWYAFQINFTIQLCLDFIGFRHLVLFTAIKLDNMLRTQGLLRQPLQYFGNARFTLQKAANLNWINYYSCLLLQKSKSVQISLINIFSSILISEFKNYRMHQNY